MATESAKLVVSLTKKATVALAVCLTLTACATLTGSGTSPDNIATGTIVLDAASPVATISLDASEYEPSEKDLEGGGTRVVLEWESQSQQDTQANIMASLRKGRRTTTGGNEGVAEATSAKLVVELTALDLDLSGPVELAWQAKAKPSLYRPDSYVPVDTSVETFSQISSDALISIREGPAVAAKVSVTSPKKPSSSGLNLTTIPTLVYADPSQSNQTGLKIWARHRNLPTGEATPFEVSESDGQLAMTWEDNCSGKMCSYEFDVVIAGVSNVAFDDILEVDSGDPAASVAVELVPIEERSTSVVVDGRVFQDDLTERVAVTPQPLTPEGPLAGLVVMAIDTDAEDINQIDATITGAVPFDEAHRGRVGQPSGVDSRDTRMYFFDLDPGKPTELTMRFEGLIDPTYKRHREETNVDQLATFTLTFFTYGVDNTQPATVDLR